jgi:hypothetical protein
VADTMPRGLPVGITSPAAQALERVRRLEAQVGAVADEVRALEATARRIETLVADLTAALQRGAIGWWGGPPGRT